MRRTKIVCTIGPATSSPEALRALISAGMDVARLNFSHGTHKAHAEVISHIRAISTEMKQPVAILQDLSGPKIRLGRIEGGPVLLESGSRFTLTTRDVPGSAEEVSLTYKGLPSDVSVGNRLMLCDGNIELVVEGTTATDISCLVVIGGLINSHKGINTPDASVNAAIPTDKDRADLAFGLQQGVDFVAMSFVRNEKDVLAVRGAMQEAGGEVPLIAKIERHEALAEIDGIIAAADGIMVARGDLGVEIPIEQVARVQKMLVDRAVKAGKPVITATQMLRSMVSSPRPTRAEATDVANAILDGTDAVMLSEETAIGQYPADAVSTMVRIAEDIESVFPYDSWQVRVRTGEALSQQEAVARETRDLALSVGAAAIVTCTESGSTTRMVAKYRPNMPLYALTPNPATFRQLALTSGALPIAVEYADTVEELEKQAIELLRERGLVEQGCKVVLTAGVPLREAGTTNVIKILEV